jgi:hypothetical protein
LLLGGVSVALFALRDWDASHRLYHAVALAILLATIPLMRSPAARTLQAMVLGASLAEILLRARLVTHDARHPLTSVWIGLAVLYALGFAFMFWYDRRLKRANRDPA